MRGPSQTSPDPSEATVSRPKDSRVRASSIDLARQAGREARGKGLRTVELARGRAWIYRNGAVAEAGQTEAIARSIGEFASHGAVRGRGGSARVLDSVGHDGSTTRPLRGNPGELSLPGNRKGGGD